MFDNTHAHITTWVVAFILFAVALSLQRGSNQKGFKIVQMILRLFYIFIVVTGAMIFFKHQSFDAALYGMKFVFGIIVIGMMEMILVRGSKGKSTGIAWVLFLVSVAITFFLGFKLPLGWNFLG